MFESAQYRSNFPKLLCFRNIFSVASFLLLLVPASLSFKTPVARLHSKTNPRQVGRRWNFAAKPLSESDVVPSSFQSVKQSERRRCTSVRDHSESVSVFDPSVGYGDMTGVKKFDDAWIDAFRKKDRIRCPFWRRRAVDLLEAVLSGARFLASRHKSLDVTPVKPTGNKRLGLSIAALSEVIRADFEARQYYVTGRLTKAIYADDCFFDAPDPDMPVTGLRKYVDAISHLFEHKSSKVDLLSLEVVGPDRVMARWRLEGTLMLPWRPRVKAYTGVTVYTQDPVTGLVTRHVERWSVSALDAFASALLPVAWPAAVAAAAAYLPPAAIAFACAPPAPSRESLLALPEVCRGPDPTSLLAEAQR